MTEKLYNEILVRKETTIKSLERRIEAMDELITEKDAHIAQLRSWIDDLRGSIQHDREIINSLQLQQEEGKFFWIAGEA